MLIAVGVAGLLLAGDLADERTAHWINVGLVGIGTVAVVVGVRLVSPLAIRALAACPARLPIAVRVALRDLVRFPSRSAAALAAITLALGIPVAIVVSASAAQHTAVAAPLLHVHLAARYVHHPGGHEQPRYGSRRIRAVGPRDEPPTDRRRDPRRPHPAASAGLTVETRDHQQGVASLRSGATAVGMLLALGVLAVTVALIRSEAAGDLRDLTATGATSTIRRAITAATAGALAALGVVLGATAGLVVLGAGYVEDVGTFARLPVVHLLLIAIARPLPPRLQAGCSQGENHPRSAGSRLDEITF